MQKAIVSILFHSTQDTVNTHRVEREKKWKWKTFYVDMGHSFSVDIYSFDGKYGNVCVAEHTNHWDFEVIKNVRSKMKFNLILVSFVCAKNRTQNLIERKRF